jgi:hypothetical protein
MQQNQDEMRGKPKSTQIYIKLSRLRILMEYRTVSTKLPSNESTLFRVYCEKKGVSPSNLIRELILREMEITIPHAIAGKNKIEYDKNQDSFKWSIELDTGENIEVLKNVSPDFFENLFDIIKLCLDERCSFIHKKNGKSVPVPSSLLRREK